MMTVRALPLFFLSSQLDALAPPASTWTRPDSEPDLSSPLFSTGFPRQIFHALHLAYLQAISNPFHPQPTNGARDPKAFESSKKFEHRIAEIVEGVNSVGQVAA